MRRLSILPAVALALVVLLPTHSEAAAIILRTGVDAGQSTLGENVADPFWTISVQGGGFVAAEVINSEVICCGMESVSSAAVWISDPSVTDGSDATGWGIGPTAIARRTFDLTGLDPTTAVLSGIWRVADYRSGVYLNGVLVDPLTADNGSGWFSDQSFSTATGFVSGLNVLELRGTSGNSQWDGFWLDALVEAREVNGNPVPEPGTLTLIGLGLAGIRATRKNRKS